MVTVLTTGLGLHELPKGPPESSRSFWAEEERESRPQHRYFKEREMLQAQVLETKREIAQREREDSSCPKQSGGGGAPNSTLRIGSQARLRVPPSHSGFLRYG